MITMHLWSVIVTSQNSPRNGCTLAIFCENWLSRLKSTVSGTPRTRDARECVSPVWRSAKWESNTRVRGVSRESLTTFKEQHLLVRDDLFAEVDAHQQGGEVEEELVFQGQEGDQGGQGGVVELGGFRGGETETGEERTRLREEQQVVVLTG